MTHRIRKPRLLSAWAHMVTLASTILVVLSSSTFAWAYGRVEWKSRTVDERTSTKSWHLEIKMFLPKAPDMAHMPMKFEFEPVAYFERSMVDGDKVLDRRVPLEHRQPLIESVDVGFMDPGTGQIQSRTKFTFKVTRAHGYEAGEYKVTIRDSRNDRTIGTPTTLTFKGENEIIDRRSIVFTGKKKEKAKEPEQEPASEPAAETETADTEADDELAEEDDDGAVPPSVQEKPGGCGCHHGPAHEQPLLWALLGAVVVGFIMRRREAHN